MFPIQKDTFLNLLETKVDQIIFCALTKPENKNTPAGNENTLSKNIILFLLLNLNKTNKYGQMCIGCQIAISCI